MKCKPYKTITFNRFRYSDGMTYEKNTKYKCQKEKHLFKVFLDGGYLYFNPQEFNQYFEMEVIKNENILCVTW